LTREELEILRILGENIEPIDEASMGILEKE
jgi:hypothetical protein